MKYIKIRISDEKYDFLKRRAEAAGQSLESLVFTAIATSPYTREPDGLSDTPVEAKS